MTETDVLETISKVIYRSGALTFGDFVLSSGQRSSYYIDLGVLFSYPDLRDRTAELLVRACQGIDTEPGIDKIGAPTVKGALWGSLVSYRMSKPLIVLDGEDGSVLHGSIEPEERILVLDDVVNSGSTLGRCVENATEEFGGMPVRCQVILDRSKRDGLDDRLSEVDLESLATLGELAEQLDFQGVIGPEQKSILSEDL
jgi:orotate phosphoribosyltransferase